MVLSEEVTALTVMSAEEAWVNASTAVSIRHTTSLGHGRLSCSAHFYNMLFDLRPLHLLKAN